MHRSGTSFLTRAIISSGVFMGKFLDVNSESIPFIEFNEELLSKNHLSWDSIGPLNKHMDFRISVLLKHFLKNNPKGLNDLFSVLRNKEWGWKDPRNTINMLYWLKIFPKAKVIFIYRNGYDVANSLLKRNNKLDKGSKHYSKKMISLESTFGLWEDYNSYFFELKNQIPNEQLMLVKYEDILKSDKETLHALDKFIGLNISNNLLRSAEADKVSKINPSDYPDYMLNSEFMKKFAYA